MIYFGFLSNCTFLTSTKFPTLEFSFKIVSGLILAYGPISTLFSTLQFSKWENELILTLLPILTFCNEGYEKENSYFFQKP